MPGDAYRKVRPGDKLRLPAVVYNGLIDLLRARGPVTGGAPGATERHSGIVHIRNDSGAPCSRGEVLCVTGRVFDPAGADEVAGRVALTGDLPASGDDAGFVVLLEPIPAGALGRALASGVCAALVEMTDAEHYRADLAAGSAVLVSSASGPAQILTVEPGLGEKWAIVRLSNPSEPGALPPGGEEYQVLQRDDAGDAVWDWVRAH